MPLCVRGRLGEGARTDVCAGVRCREAGCGDCTCRSASVAVCGGGGVAVQGLAAERKRVREAGAGVKAPRPGLRTGGWQAVWAGCGRGV